MRWTPGSRNENLEDRRGQSGGGGFRGGGGGLKLGLGGTVVVLVLSLVFGKDFTSMLDGGGAPATSEQPVPGAPVASSPAEDRMVEFVNFLLTDTQNVWRQIFTASGQPYQEPKLVLFRDGVESACGFAQSATGPFYCPGDQKVYIDLGFFDELGSKFGAPGEFARAYVLAHEFGHHVQNLLGTERELRRAQGQNPEQANALSVAMELQADCFAGIWAASANKRSIVEPGDFEGGLTAAAAVGDDRLQQKGQGRVHPESFTHGSSAQRMEWFKRGFSEGSVAACNTFGR
ncbi:MAG: zinc metallopeptidase [Phycisphaerae bacterium]|nr:zinc metallopeptidase [Gemmatimonadaceae bacterium]